MLAKCFKEQMSKAVVEKSTQFNTVVSSEMAGFVTTQESTHLLAHTVDHFKIFCV